jgi:hypothetical protein
MRRLREGQAATLSPCLVERTPLTCRVVSAGRTSVALYPLPRMPLLDSRELDDVYLLFEFGGQPIALRGSATFRELRDVRFHATDGVVLSRRSASRLRAELPVELALPGAVTRRLSTTTRDFSADGMLVVDPGGVELGESVDIMFRPDGREAIRVRAEAIRRSSGGLALAFRTLTPGERGWIDEHIIAVKRALLIEVLEGQVALKAL